MTRNKLYVLLSAACLVGYFWLFISYTNIVSHGNELGVCLFKQITGIPCPSCGSTRSVLALLNGDLISALKWNPIGLILVVVIVISPLWILFDVSTKRESLFHFYIRGEQLLRHKWIAILAIVLVLLNWVWNIYKGV